MAGSETRILIAHANRALRRQIAETLQAAGHHVQQASTARQALRSLEADPPDLLLLDTGMLGQNDHPLLHSLRDHPLRATTAILAVDPNVLLDETESWVEAGADDVAAGGLDPAALRLKVRALLRLKLAERAARRLAALRARDQAALQRAARRLAAAPSLPDAVAALALAARADLGYDRAAVALYDPRSHALRPAPDGRPALSLAPGSPLRDLPPFQPLFDPDQPLYYLPDTAGRAPAYFRPFLDGPVREALLVALRSPAGPVGLLAVDNLPSGRPLPLADAPLLVTLAAHAALALERARLADRAAARARDADAAARLAAALAAALDPPTLRRAALDHLAAALPCDHASILTFEEKWAVLSAIWGDPSLPEHTPVARLEQQEDFWIPARDAGVVYLPDTAQESDWRDIPPWIGEHRLRSVISVPLSGDGDTYSAVHIGSFTPDRYSDQQVQLAAEFGIRIDLALRNARLYLAEQERAQAAEGLARLRNEFVASVSHELRTPLTAIIGFAEILQDRWDQLDDRTRLQWIEKIVGAAGRQRRLVEDLLLVTRLEAGELSLSLQQASLYSIIRRAADEMQGSYPGQRIDLLGTDGLIVLADPDRVLQIVAILLDNAIKYSEEGSPVIIWWGAEDGRAKVRVLDRGKGIPAGNREQLFTRFGRVPNSRIRAGRVGTGLGLYIGRSLARTMSGDLDLEVSSAEGSTFVLTLPLTPAS